jgi:hypothetical protein
MPANINAIFPLTPNWGVAAISAANANRVVTGVAGLTLLMTAGANGTRVDSITMIATATTTAGMIRVWKYGGSGNAALVLEQLVAAIVPSATVAAWSAEALPPNWTLAAGESLYVSTNNAEAFNIHARGGDY